MRKKIPCLLLVLALAVSLGTAPAALAQKTVQTPLNPKAIPQFVDLLPLLQDLHTGGTMETVLFPEATTQTQIYMHEFLANVLPTGFVPPGIPAGNPFSGTWVWGYRKPAAAPALADTYIGPVFVVNRDTPTEIKFVNNLGTTSTTNVLAWKQSTDQTMHWADPLALDSNECAEASTPQNPRVPPGVAANGTLCAENYGWDPILNANKGGWTTAQIPAVVHLHGGEVPPVLDGGPDAWVTSGASPYSGHGYYSKDVTNQGDPAPGPYMIYRYPNTQEAANIWFHDHVLGTTRLNVYAGLAGAYVITDAANDPANLPGPIVPLVIQDRMFDTNGQLFFPADQYTGVVWTPNPEHPYWVPEFVGDVIVVNGKTWPKFTPDPKRYRFLFLNGSNARTYELFLINQATGAPGPAMYVIGTDGGYLDKSVKIDPAAGQKLVIMPGERYDVIIDFNGFAGQTLLMRNTGRTPFPKGAPPNGATVGRIMQFVVNAPQTPPQDTTFNPAPGGVAVRMAPMVRLPGTPQSLLAINTTNVQKFRQLTLNEVMLPPVTVNGVAYPGGPYEVLLNNTKWTGKAPGGSIIPGQQQHQDQVPSGPQHDYYYSENPLEGETELWEIVNISADAHPIHLHLVQFQIVNRQNFNVNKYTKAYNAAFPGGGTDPLTGNPFPAGVYMPAYGPPLTYSPATPPMHALYNAPILGGNPDVNLYLQGAAQLPLAQEEGWKDTVISYPGQVLRLMVRWAPTDIAAGLNPTIPANAVWFPFSPDSGHGYVWHCHIIDHEDNEMMRPTSVANNPAFTGTRYTDY